EHERDDDEHDDGADVDEHLDEGDELGTEDEMAAGETEPRDDEPERGVHHVARGDGERGGGRGDQAGGGEGEVQSRHRRPPARPARAGLLAAVTSGASAAAGSSSGGAGTSATHWPRRSFSWR